MEDSMPGKPGNSIYQIDGFCRPNVVFRAPQKPKNATKNQCTFFISCLENFVKSFFKKSLKNILNSVEMVLEDISHRAWHFPAAGLSAIIEAL
jgi:hypothetical protein